MKSQTATIFQFILLSSFFVFFTETVIGQSKGCLPKEPPLDVTSRFEISAHIGATTFFGDLGGNIGRGMPFAKDFDPRTIHPFVGLSLGYYPANYLKFKFSISHTSVNGADSLIHNQGSMERWRYYRNLSFRSRISDASLEAEFYPLIWLSNSQKLQWFDPFFSIGIGAFRYNPQAKLNGNWIDLQPLHLEGQGFPEYPNRKPYSLTQLYIPYSAGIKYYLNDNWSVSAAMLWRRTFTDYIDDISTTYINPVLFDKYLPADKAALAKQLYSRSKTPWKVRPNIEKADSRDRDSYVTMLVTVSWVMKKQVKVFYGGF